MSRRCDLAGECTGTDRSLGRSAAPCLRFRVETTFRRDGPCVLTHGDSHDKTSVPARWTVFGLIPSVLSSRFPQARYSAVLCRLVPSMPWKRKRRDGRCMVSSGLKFRPAVRKRTKSRISRGTHPPRRGIQRRRQTVPTAISATGDFLRAQPVTRGVFPQPAKPSRESTVQIRLASLAWGCRNRMRDPPNSRVRCLSSAQRVRTSQIRRAPLGASVLSSPSAFRRIQLAARSSALVLGWRRADSPCSGRTTLGFGPLEIASEADAEWS